MKKWIAISKKKPPFYDEVWVLLANGSVELDQRDTDTYFGGDRLHFKMNGFPDIKEKYAVTHWMKYAPPKPPKPLSPSKYQSTASKSK